MQCCDHSDEDWVWHANVFFTIANLNLALVDIMIKYLQALIISKTNNIGRLQKVN